MEERYRNIMRVFTMARENQIKRGNIKEKLKLLNRTEILWFTGKIRGRL